MKAGTTWQRRQFIWVYATANREIGFVGAVRVKGGYPWSLGFVAPDTVCGGFSTSVAAAKRALVRWHKKCLAKYHR